MHNPDLTDPDFELLVGAGLTRRLRELAAAGAEAPGDTGLLARRGFSALAGDIAIVLPAELRSGFRRRCARILADAIRRREPRDTSAATPRSGGRS